MKTIRLSLMVVNICRTTFLICLLTVACLLSAAPAFANGNYYLSDIAGSGTPEDPYWLIATEIAVQEECDTIWSAANTNQLPWALLYVDNCLDYSSFLGLPEINKIPHFGVHVKLSAMSPMAKNSIVDVLTARNISTLCFDNSDCFMELVNCICRQVPGFSNCSVENWGDW